MTTKQNSTQEDERIKKRFTDVERSKTFMRIVNVLDLKEKQVLDIGCGYGEYMAYFGKGSVGITTTKKEVEYGAKNNLNIIYGNAEEIDTLNITKHFDVIWSNNFFEHILSPHAFLMKLKKLSHKDTIIIMGVPVIPSPFVLTKLRKFRGSLATPHINFFTKETLRHTIERTGWNIIDIRSFVFDPAFFDHMTSRAMPHLYYIAKNNSDFVYPEKKLAEWKDVPYYKHLLAVTAQDETSI